MLKTGTVLVVDDDVADTENVRELEMTCNWKPLKNSTRIISRQKRHEYTANGPSADSESVRSWVLEYV
jgi:hypothetical protein